MSTPTAATGKNKAPEKIINTDTGAPTSTPKVAKEKSPGNKKDPSTVTPAPASPAKVKSEQRTSPKKRNSPAKTELPEWGKSIPSKLKLKKKAKGSYCREQSSSCSGYCMEQSSNSGGYKQPTNC